MISLPHKEADLLVIGAGILGAAVAYYYKRDNPEKRVLVFDQNSECSGNTGLAAALLTRVRNYSHIVPLSLETYRIISELDEINSDKIPVKYPGAVHLAANPEQEMELERLMQICSIHGIEWEYIDNKRSSDLVPWLNARSATRIAFIEKEAYTDPYIFGSAFVNAAKKLGVVFQRNTKILGINRDDDRVTGVRTGQEFYHGKDIVLAAGVWSVSIAASLGLALPMAPVRSQYWVTDNYGAFFSPDSPMVIIPEAQFYSRPFGSSLIFGIRESRPIYTDPRMLPDSVTDFDFNYDDGWCDLEKGFPKILPFFPNSIDIGIKKYVAGYSGYTPDNQFILGEVPGLSDLFLATGCSGAGISVAGGIGLGISRLVAGKENPFDFCPHNVNRFGKIDPFSEEHLRRCGLARSFKTSG